MTLLEYLAIALSFAIDSMIVMHRQASAAPIKLTRGIAIAATFAIVYSLAILAGYYIGDILRLESGDTSNLYERTNSLICIGLVCVVMVKQLLSLRPSKIDGTAFNIARTSTALALAIAAAVNPMIVGLGAGFLTPDCNPLLCGAFPLAVAVLLSSVWGIMLGRQNIGLRYRRWGILSALLLMAVIVYRIATL